MHKRIGQLEKLVVDLLGNMQQSDSSSMNSMVGADSPNLPPDFGHVDYTQDPSQLDDRFGRMSLGTLGTKYVENDHWSSILDGVRAYAFCPGTVSLANVATYRLPS